MSDSSMMGDANNSDVTRQICKHSSEYCPKCYPTLEGIFIWKLFKYLFGYSLCSRLFTLLFVLQAAVLWIGYSLNCVLQFLFLPFVYSSTKSTSTMDFAFLSSCFVLPGIISFSSHYFWFIVQFGFHCYSNEDIKEKNRNEIIETSSCSKCQQEIQNNNQIDPENIDYALLFFPQYKHYYRILIISSMIIYFLYRIYKFSEDIFTSLIVTLGLFPLGIMWILHIIHMVGMLYFVIESFNRKTNQIDIPKKPIDNKRIHIPIIVIVFIMIICIGQVFLLWLNIFYHIILTMLLFSIYILLYCQTPRKTIECDDNQIYCCCCCSNENFSKPKPILYRPNFFVKIIEKFLQFCFILKKDKHFHFYKLFISIVLYVLLLSLNQILQHYFDKYKLFILFFLQIIIFLLWIPPLFNHDINQWIIDKQINLVECLILFICSTSMITILCFPIYYELNTGVSFIFLIFIGLYTGLLFLYYIKHWSNSSSSVVPLVQWVKSHESVSIYMQALSVMFILLASIGFFGLSFGSSIYAEAKQNKDNPSLYPYTVSGNFKQLNLNENQRQYPMQACHWKFGEFSIQDMTLLAALAYIPTERLKTELNHFYPNSDINFDENFHNYQEYGYGEITYYTLDTKQAVIVVIRGTTLPYEWLIDFDIWTESTINQMISILFPWSRLYPRTVHKIIIRQMSLLENIFGEKKSINKNEKHTSKRFYVKDMIDILKRINIKYQNKSLILVGHSLGGGLAKLAGITLDNTIGIVSISGPGISYTRAKYDETDGVLMDTINKRVFNIIHDRDVVPWADKQAGLVQYMTCPKVFNRLECHSINPIFCNLLKNCGNPRNFSINKDICQP